MRYHLDDLLQRLNNGETFKYLFFWGHMPYDPPRATCLSQWYEASFEVEGTCFATAEHWMMAEKARTFGDEEHYEQIIQATHPNEAKKLGRKVRNFDSKVWDARRYDIVVEGNQHKFEQNPILADYLKNTGERVIVEASPVDAIWGIGLPKNHLHAAQPWQWRGTNLLGFALMEVRDEL